MKKFLEGKQEIIAGGTEHRAVSHSRRLYEA